MIANMKQKLLESIGVIFEKSKECKLEPSFFESIDGELNLLTDYFGATKTQTFLIAMIFALNYKGDTVDIADLIKHLDCNPMKLLEYSDDFEVLYSNGFVKRQASGHRVKIALSNDQYTINEEITQAILNNEPMPEVEEKKCDYNNIFEVLEELYELFTQREDGEITSSKLLSKTMHILIISNHLPLIKKIEEYKFNIEDSYFYLYLIWKMISGEEKTDVSRTVQGIFSKATVRINFIQKIMTGEHDLIRNDLAEIVIASFFNDTQIKLTEKSLDLLTACDIKLFSHRKKRDNIIEPSQIQWRKLLFKDEEMRQLDLLKHLLQDSNFAETQTRLTSRNLPKGITALLHGAPGTGKTETVMQLAKETGREIMKVEISQSKSMWFGESEKIIKRIFTDYKALVKESDRTPILLFNEADAIISKRRENGNSSVSQTENVIQNVLLEELENFEGILFATTNLAKNFDTAFERRFLFKIEFQKPDISTKAKIWKLKLPKLSEPDCEMLAARFDFSGGQIDNIVRKNEIHEIIHGISEGITNIVEFCSEESLQGRKVAVGFLHG